MESERHLVVENKKTTEALSIDIIYSVNINELKRFCLHKYIHFLQPNSFSSVQTTLIFLKITTADMFCFGARSVGGG